MLKALQTATTLIKTESDLPQSPYVMKLKKQAHDENYCYLDAPPPFFRKPLQRDKFNDFLNGHIDYQNLNTSIQINRFKSRRFIQETPSPKSNTLKLRKLKSIITQRAEILRQSRYAQRYRDEQLNLANTLRTAKPIHKNYDNIHTCHKQLKQIRVNYENLSQVQEQDDYQTKAHLYQQINQFSEDYLANIETINQQKQRKLKKFIKLNISYSNKKIHLGQEPHFDLLHKHKNKGLITTKEIELYDYLHNLPKVEPQREPRLSIKAIKNLYSSRQNPDLDHESLSDTDSIQSSFEHEVDTYYRESRKEQEKLYYNRSLAKKVTAALKLDKLKNQTISANISKLS